MRIPTATYRIQFTPEFGFAQAAEIVAYLAELGISDLYASPIFAARSGSTHGYDLVDPERLNPELGSEADFHHLSTQLGNQQMGWLQDIVPNHMAFDAQNPYLADILENGPSSAYYHYFDIDWDHYYETIRGKVLAPFLGSYFGHALENGDLRLSYSRQGFAVGYFDLAFPLKIESYFDILEESVPTLLARLGEDHPDYIQFLGILYVLKTLRSEAGSNERYAQIRFVKQNLWTLYQKNPVILATIDSAIESINGRPGEPASFNQLENLLGDQWFRLAYWKVACEEINYRRFFSINDLISVQVEAEDVFQQTHALILRLVADGQLTGLRVDHVDGLYDPRGYLDKLRREAPGCYLVVEKILAMDEPLPPWPIQGTTGYDFMNVVNGVFCATENEKLFSQRYRNFADLRESCADLLYAQKKLIIERYLFGEVNNLAYLLKNMAGRHRYGSDITMDSLKRALIEVLALLPVYRTYLDGEQVRDFDRRVIQQALNEARARNPAHLNEIDYIGRVFSGEVQTTGEPDESMPWRHFIMRFQQVSGPLMAKGGEDTLLYVYNRLLSLNEVGGEPERFGIEPKAFHTFTQRRQNEWPHAMNATATHDTKRGEDVRARLNVLSELPHEWARLVRSWSRLNRGRKLSLQRRKAPDRNDEYFLYQILVGAWPLDTSELAGFGDRLAEYLVKAVREAKVHTNWLTPDTDYENAFVDFARIIIEPGGSNAFLEEFLPFQRKVAHFGMLNGLAQTLVKITAPGVADFYQGTEFWDLSLVDPDNRRPVDYAYRRKALQNIRAREGSDLHGLIDDLLASMSNGWVKLFLIQRALDARNRQPLLFQEGDYRPLQVNGPGQDHVLAFARQFGDQAAVTVVPRLLAGWLEEGALPLGKQVWQETWLQMPPEAGGEWRDIFTGSLTADGSELPIGDLLARFPVGLLLGRIAR